MLTPRQDQFFYVDYLDKPNVGIALDIKRYRGGNQLATNTNDFRLSMNKTFTVGGVTITTAMTYCYTDSTTFVLTDNTYYKWKIEVGNLDDIKELTLPQHICGDIDLSRLKKLKTFYTIVSTSDNTTLSSITFAESDVITESIRILGSEPYTKLKTINISGLTNFAGDFRLGNAINLTAITFPTSNQEISLTLNSNNLTGALVLSGLTNLLYLTCAGNANLNNIIFSTTPNYNYFYLDAQSCELNGDLNLSSFKNLNHVSLSNNDLRTITIPDSSSAITTFVCESNINLSGINFTDVQFTNTASISFSNCNSLSSFTHNNDIQFDDLTLSGCKISNDLDFSANQNINMFNMVGTSTRYNTLTALTFSDSGTINKLLIGYSNIKNLYISGLTFSGTTTKFDCNYMPNLSSLTFKQQDKSSGDIMSILKISMCGALYDLNLSTLPIIGGSIDIRSCVKLTGLTMPYTSNPVTDIIVGNHDSLSALTLTSLTYATNSTVQLSAMYSLTDLLIPTGATSSSLIIEDIPIKSGNLDLSGWNNLSTLNIIGGGNPPTLRPVVITSVTLPNNNSSMTNLEITCTHINDLILTGITTHDNDVITITYNNYLSSITFKDYTTAGIDIYRNPLLRSLDFSKVTLDPVSAAINIYGNQSLTAITFSGNTPSVTTIELRENDLRNIDLTGFKNYSTSNVSIYIGGSKLGASFPIKNNNLESITFATTLTNASLQNLELQNTKITSLNLSGFTRATNSGLINLSGNTQLTSLILPSLSSSYTGGTVTATYCALGVMNYSNMNSKFRNLNYQYNGMTTAEVNENLVVLVNMNWTGGTSHVIDFRNNSAPDGSSGGFDGLTAKSTLQTRGWTVNTD